MQLFPVVITPFFRCRVWCSPLPPNPKYFSYWFWSTESPWGYALKISLSPSPKTHISTWLGKQDTGLITSARCPHTDAHMQAKSHIPRAHYLFLGYEVSPWSLKHMTVILLTPTTLSSVVLHVSVHASAQSLRITKQKSLSHARLVLLSPNHSFVAGLRGMWSSAGDQVCIRAVMIQGVLGWFFLSHQPIRMLTEALLLWQEAGQLLLWLSGSSSDGGDGSELRLQFHCTLWFGTLELHQYFRW